MDASISRPSLTHRCNPVTRALREGRVCLGSLSLSFPGAAVAQIFARAGFSWYYLDMEHAQIDYEDVARLSLASKLAGIVPIAGPSSLADHLVARPLDAGAMGVLAPHVETPEQTEDVVRWARYPPVGARGLYYPGLHGGFEVPDAQEWIENQNREVLVAVKVESGRGIENIEEIASVPGLDAILIGPTDLSATLGIPGQTGHPEVIDAIERTLAAAKASGISAGPTVGDAQEAARWVDKGATFLNFGFDGELLLRACTAHVSAARDLLGTKLL